MTYFNKPYYLCQIACILLLQACQPFGENKLKQNKTTLEIEYGSTTFSSPVLQLFSSGVAIISTVTVENCSISPSLPSGLSINPTTCEISGTPTFPTSGSYTITATSSKAIGRVEVSLNFTQVIPDISYTGGPFQFNLNSSSTTGIPSNTGGAITSCAVSPTLPTGLSISNTTCAISGTPTVVTAAADYTITPSNAIGSGTARVINIEIANIPPSIAYSSATYVFNLNAIGSTTGTPTNIGGAITSCTVSPTLPTGLVISNTTCAISGTPTVVTVAADYTVTPSNAIGSGTARMINIAIANIPPSITYSSATYVFNLNAAGSTTGTPTNIGGAITNCIVSPTLPTGLSINATSCVISGTPTVVTAAANYTVTPSNAFGSGTARVLNIAIANVAPSISYSSSNYSFNLYAAGSTTGSPSNSGGAITDCIVSPALPTGLSINTTTCVIAGTPTVVTAAADYTVTPSNTIGSGIPRVINIGIANIVPSIAYSNSTYSFNLNATGSTTGTPTNIGGAITSCAVSPTLPTGLLISNTTCAISGTPTLATAAADYTITPSNGIGSGTARVVNITIANIAPSISYSSATYAFTFNNASSTTGVPTNTGGAITSCAISPTLPTGLSINATTCVISGTPSATIASTAFTVTATNLVGSSTVIINLSIAPNTPLMSYVGSPGTNGTVGIPMSVTPLTFDTRGEALSSCSISPTLSAGLSIDNSTCVISGTPSAVSVATIYTVTATNSAGSTIDTVTLTVAANSPAISFLGSTGTSGTVGLAMSITPTMSDRGAAITSCTTTALPAGLTINNLTCVISGTPTVTLSSTAFTVTATNSVGSTNASVTLVIAANTPVISYSGSPGTSGTAGTAMSVTPTSLNPRGSAIYACSTDIALPSGLNISGTTCVISGTPTVGLSSTLFTVTATNSIGSTSATVTLSVTDTAPVAANLTPNAFTANTQSIMTLSYTDAESQLATSCALSSLTNVSVTQACACDGSGVCTVGVTGTADYFGSASFNYTVTTSNLASNSATTSFMISGWYQEAYIKAANAEANDQFGVSVSISGDTLVVGAFLEDSDLTTITNATTASPNNSAINSGAAYVYKRTGVSWAQEAYIKAANAEADDFFGVSVFVSGDTMVVGANGEASNQTIITNGTTASANNSAAYSGAAYVYKRTGLIWAQEAYIKASNLGANDQFGTSVSMSGDTIVIGAAGESSNQTTITNGTTASTNNSAPESGAAYVYKRTGASWAQEAYLKAANAEAYDYFGYSVSVSGDTIVIGNSQEDSNQTIITNGTAASSNNSVTNSGAAYVYKRTGTNWAQEAYLKAANADLYDNYGWSVSLSGDTIVVGAYQESSNQTIITNGTSASANNSAAGSGAAYVYKRTGTTWAQEAYLKAANAEAFDYFGLSFFVSGDTIVVGSLYEDSNQTTITNGTTANSNNFAAESGAAYVYKRTGASWSQEAYLKAANADANFETYGVSISVSGDTIVVGASLEDSNQTIITNGTTASTNNSAGESGAVYIYRNTTRLFEPVELSSSVTANSITLNWIKNGGSATGYYVSYSLGSIAPATCLAGTSINVGSVSTYTLSSLSTGSTYSFRICSTRNGTNFSDGVTVTRTTDAAPVAANVTPSDLTTNTQSIITLSYTDAEGHLAQTCSIITLSNVTVTQACSCSAGVCTVGITSTSGHVGTGSFTYTVNGNNLSSNSATVSFNVLGTGWYQEAYIKAANTGAGDLFGGVVSISGDTVVVSSYEEDSNQTTITNGTSASANNSAGNSGAAYVYKRTGSSWAQEAYIKAANPDGGDYFGTSVSISGDTIVAGARYESSNLTTITNGSTASANNSAGSSGAAYVYKRTGSTWAQQAYIKASNADGGDEFGASVSISGDTMVVGAPGESSNQTTITNGTSASANNSTTASGAAYVYKRTGTNWAREAYIKAANPDVYDFFGWSISLSGETIVVGSFLEDSNQTTITNGTTASADNSALESGSTYVYKRTGNNWAQEAYLKAANAEADENFGRSVSISGDTIVVSAFNEDSNQTTITNGTTASANNSASNSGAAYVYKRIGASWAQEAYLKAANAETNDYFGSSVSISGDTIVVGATGEDSNQTTITNGTTASANNLSSSVGAAYVYNRTATNWAQEAYIKAANAEGGDGFGISVSISGDTIVVGAYREASNQITITNGTTASTDNSVGDSGAAYIYRNTGRLFDVPELAATSTSSSVTLNWIKSGGNATGYFVAYTSGSTAPANCSSGTNIDAGDVATFTELALSSSTTYSFRVCSTRNGTTFSSGMTKTITTLP